MKETSIIFLYNRFNRYSVNTILGAMESAGIYLPQISLCRDFNQIRQKLNSASKKTLVCISFATAQSDKTYEEIKSLKKNGVMLIAGGPHPSAMPQQALEKGFNFVFSGEAEETFTSFLQKMAEGKTPSEKIIKAKKPVDLDKYLSFSRKFLRFGPIEITRGCPYACKFCQTSYIFGAAQRHRSINKILEQVYEMRKLGLNDIRFLTPDALSYASCGLQTNLEAVEDLLKSVKSALPSEGRIFFGTFPGEIRPERISEKALDLIKKYCANKQLTVGIQSASDSMLKKCGRGHDSASAMEAVKLCIEKGFTPVTDFIFGLPDEKEDDIERNLEFIEKISLMGAIIHTHSFMPLPGTPWSNKKTGVIPKRLRLKLKHLENRRLAFGKWEKDSRQD